MRLKTGKNILPRVGATVYCTVEPKLFQEPGAEDINTVLKLYMDKYMSRTIYVYTYCIGYSRKISWDSFTGKSIKRTCKHAIG